MSAPVYLDHAATTPVDPAVVQAMADVLGAPVPGNPASGHVAGERAAARIEAAREQVAALIGACASSIVFTSGATEADNLAVLGAARAQRSRGRGDHVVTVATEHKAVLAPCDRLEREGFRVTRLAPAPDGGVTAASLAEVLDEATALVSVMHVNNETGVIQDITAIGELARSAGALMHVDAAQSAGHLSLDVDALPVDLMSLSAHKMHGPPGVGALYVRQRPRARLQPLLLGGGQERGLRAGTVPLHQVVGMGEACRLVAERRQGDEVRLRDLRARLEAGLAEIGGMVRNGRRDGAAHILNVAVLGVHGEALRAALPGLAVTAGSACSAREPGVSHVLRAMGLSEALAGAALRLSLARTTTENEVRDALDLLGDAVARLRGFSPVWREIRDGRDPASVYGVTAELEQVA